MGECGQHSVGACRQHSDHPRRIGSRVAGQGPGSTLGNELCSRMWLPPLSANARQAGACLPSVFSFSTILCIGTGQTTLPPPCAGLQAGPSMAAWVRAGAASFSPLFSVSGSVSMGLGPFRAACPLPSGWHFPGPWQYYVLFHLCLQLLAGMPTLRVAASSSFCPVRSSKWVPHRKTLLLSALLTWPWPRAPAWDAALCWEGRSPQVQQV